MLTSRLTVSATRLGSEEIVGGIDHDGIDDDAAGAGTTTLISDLVMAGYLGPMDIKNRKQR